MKYEVNLSDISSVMNFLKPGDTVFLLDEVISNLNIKITSIGELLKRITIQPINPGKVIVTGKISLTVSGKYTTIANIIFKNGGNSKSIILEGYGNRLTGCDINLDHSDGPIIMVRPKNNRIDHCYFHDFTKAKRWIQKDSQSTSADFFLFDHNLVKNRKEGNSNGFETIQLRNDNNKIESNSIISQNYFYNCNGELEMISVKSSGNIVSNNTIDKCKGTITLRSGYNNLIVNNKFIQSNLKDAGGIRITGEGHIIKSNLFYNIQNGNTNGTALSIINGTTKKPTYQQVKNLTILNNLFLENECDIVLGINRYDLIPDHIKFTGNVVYKTNNNPVFSKKGSKCDNVFFTNNRFFVNNMGKAPDNIGEKEDFKSFDISSINTDLYGVFENYGLNWNIPVEDTEINIEIDELYSTLKLSLI